MRDAAAFAVDVKTKLALWVFGAEINFAGRRVEAFGNDDEMMDRTLWEFLDDLSQNAHALPHLFHPNQVAIVAIARAADHDVEIVIFVVEVRMFAAQIVFD